MPTAPRRRPGEARAAIVTAARDSFAECGYQGTSLREIARLADVNEALIFRHFGTKERLFEESVIQPFHAFVEALFERWLEHDDPLTNDELVEMFVGDLYDFARQHRDIFFAMVNAERFSGTDGPRSRIGSAMSAEVDRIAAASTAEAVERGIAHANFSIVVPCIMAMVLGIVLLESWLLPTEGAHPPEDELRRWMIDHAISAIQLPSST